MWVSEEWRAHGSLENTRQWLLLFGKDLFEYTHVTEAGTRDGAFRVVLYLLLRVDTVTP